MIRERGQTPSPALAPPALGVCSSPGLGLRPRGIPWSLPLAGTPPQAVLEPTELGSDEKGKTRLTGGSLGYARLALDRRVTSSLPRVFIYYIMGVVRWDFPALNERLRLLKPHSHLLHAGNKRTNHWPLRVPSGGHCHLVQPGTRWGGDAVAPAF